LIQWKNKLSQGKAFTKHPLSNHRLIVIIMIHLSSSLQKPNAGTLKPNCKSSAPKKQTIKQKSLLLGIPISAPMRGRGIPSESSFIFGCPNIVPSIPRQRPSDHNNPLPFPLPFAFSLQLFLTLCVLTLFLPLPHALSAGTNLRRGVDMGVLPAVVSVTTSIGNTKSPLIRLAGGWAVGDGVGGSCGDVRLGVGYDGLG
jgi:hypothetical protein